MLIALAQINPVVGDIDYNLNRVIEYTEKAKARNADLVIFSETVTVGYPARDLLDRQELIDDNLKAVDEMAKHSNDIGILCGFVERNPFPGEKPLYNAAALMHKGKIILKQHKSLLPDYDVFDERRYYEPAHCVHPVEFKGIKLGITICEDMWTYSPDVSKIYKFDPNNVLTLLGADLLINLSASPYYYQKPFQRFETIQNIAKYNKKKFCYVNQVGGNDDLIFDGKSIIVDEEGSILAIAKNFEEDIIFYDTETGKGDKHNTCEDEIECIYLALLTGLKDYVRKCGFKKVVLGLSGGIDSTLTAALAAKALGPSNVIGISMPGRYSSQGSLDDAKALADNLGIEYHVVPIDRIFEASLMTIQPENPEPRMDVTEENIQARIRANIIMSFANRHNCLALTTGNKSETAVGYSTLYGDMAGGLAVISDLYKCQVYELANFINRKENNVIPYNTIIKPPSAELRPNQQDKDSLPEYNLLDKILKDYIESDLTLNELCEKYDKKLVLEILKKVDYSEFKRRQAAPGLKISARAFGSGRRLPIAQGYKWR